MAGRIIFGLAGCSVLIALVDLWDQARSTGDEELIGFLQCCGLALLILTVLLAFFAAWGFYGRLATRRAEAGIGEH